MRNLIERFTPTSPMARKLVLGVFFLGACVAAFCWGRKQAAIANSTVDPLGKFKGSGDGRVVAYLFQDTPVSREELGEFLIERFGAQRLEFLVQNKIVELEAQKHKIFVTDLEVEQRFRDDLSKFGRVPLTPNEFESNILRRLGKTMLEWKEDVLRPKIMLEKMVRSQIKITEQEVRDGFEARFGPKVECRMIVLEKGNMTAVQKTWEEVRKGPAEFIEHAKKQFIPQLAADQGKVPPIHKHFGDPDIEKTAFSLKVNEVSGTLKMQDGTYVILLCEKHLPAETKVKYEDEWMKIHADVMETKLQKRVPELFTELRQAASPRLVLDNAVKHTARVEPSPSTLVPPRSETPTLVPGKVVAPPGASPVLSPNEPLPAPGGIVLPEFPKESETKKPETKK